jgi:hypothetical protein
VVIGVAPGGGQDDPQDHTSLPVFNKPPVRLIIRDGIEARIHAAESKLAASSTDDISALRSLPRTAEAVRSLWESWDVPTRRVWLRRLLDRVMVQNGPTRGASMKERLVPVWKR